MPDLIDDIIRREGGARETDDPSDSGGRTQYGISERAHPDVWAKGYITYKDAREIYQRVYIQGEHFDRLPEALQRQVVDYGVTAGSDTATRLLQHVLSLPVDGVLGPKTLEAVTHYPDGLLFGSIVPGSVLLNLAFCNARMLEYAKLAQHRPKDLKYLHGWLRRALEVR